MTMNSIPQNCLMLLHLVPYPKIVIVYQIYRCVIDKTTNVK